jgi:hypothetical protein
MRAVRRRAAGQLGRRPLLPLVRPVGVALGCRPDSIGLPADLSILHSNKSHAMPNGLSDCVEKSARLGTHLFCSCVAARCFLSARRRRNLFRRWRRVLGGASTRAQRWAGRHSITVCTFERRRVSSAHQHGGRPPPQPSSSSPPPTGAKPTKIHRHPHPHTHKAN